MNTALIRIALRTRIHLVVMHVAIALGASVQPLTKITPSVSSTVMHKIGFDETSERNVLKEKSTILLLKKEDRPSVKSSAFCTQSNNRQLILIKNISE